MSEMLSKCHHVTFHLWAFTFWNFWIHSRKTNTYLFQGISYIFQESERNFNANTAIVNCARHEYRVFDKKYPRSEFGNYVNKRCEMFNLNLVLGYILTKTTQFINQIWQLISISLKKNISNWKCRHEVTTLRWFTLKIITIVTSVKKDLWSRVSSRHFNWYFLTLA